MQDSISNEPKRPVGRPLKYQTVPELERAINRYFKSCEERWVFKQDWVVRGDSKGKPVYDEFGQPEWIKAKVRKHIPASVPDKTALAVALGVSRRTLTNYTDREEFIPTMERAYAICEAATAAQLYTSAARGAIFNLNNNYAGWTEKQVIAGDPDAPLGLPVVRIIDERQSDRNTDTE